jgi:hypothetical protein
LEIEFSSNKVKFFDLDTINQTQEYSAQTISDRLKRIYYQKLWKRDFNFMEKGLLKDKEAEYLVGGKLELDKTNKRLVMRKPTLFIGSDRMDYYDFLGRRREHYGMQSRNWLKLCVGITAAHFLLVRVPTMFSMYFGDEVGKISEKLGATDESETALQLQRLKQHQQQK